MVSSKEDQGKPVYDLNQGKLAGVPKEEEKVEEKPKGQIQVHQGNIGNLTVKFLEIVSLKLDAILKAVEDLANGGSKRPVD